MSEPRNDLVATYEDGSALFLTGMAPEIPPTEVIMELRHPKEGRSKVTYHLQTISPEMELGNGTVGGLLEAGDAFMTGAPGEDSDDDG